MDAAAMLPYRAWRIGIPLVAAGVGLLAGLSPTLGLAAALGVVYLVIVLEHLALGLTLFVGVTFMESISGFGTLSLAKIAGGLLVVGWAARVATSEEDRPRLLRDYPLGTAAVLTFGAWTILSVVWADLPGTAFDGAQRWVLNLIMFPIVYTAVREPRHVRWVFGLFVAGAVLSAANGALVGTAASEGRLEGSGVNANELGILLLVATFMAAGLACVRELPGGLRALSVCAAVVAVFALVTTGSRGALVGFAFALVVAPFAIGPGRRLGVVVLIGLATGGAVSYAVGVAPASVERITEADATGTGRTDIWKVGLRMVRANPVVGVGSENYRTSSRDYLLQPGLLSRSDFIADKPKPAHNVYLQVLAEFGVIGLALFAAVLAFALTTLLQAARAFARQGDRSLDLLSRALFIALCGHLAAWTFSSDIYSKQLWLLLPLCLAIGTIARSRESVSA